MHTKGPWYILSGGIISNSVTSNWAGHEHFIAEIKGGNPEISAANTKLIAAAPDLLEACKAVEKWFGVNTLASDRPAKLDKILIDAIAKAE